MRDLILLLSASDADLLAARASDDRWRLANPARTDAAALPELLAGAFCVVVRLLGGRKSWAEGLDAVLASGVPIGVLSGEPEPAAALVAVSTAPVRGAPQALCYLRQG